MVRALIIGVAVLAMTAACGKPGLSPAEKTACQSVLRDASAGLSAAEAQLSSKNAAAVVREFLSTSDRMRADVNSLPNGRVRTALLGWASDYQQAALAGPTTTEGTQLIVAGANAAGALCGK